MSQKLTFYMFDDYKKINKDPWVLTLKNGYVTHVRSHQLENPQLLREYLNETGLIPATHNSVSLHASSARGKKRTKKQRKSVRKLRRKTASRRK